MKLTKKMRTDFVSAALDDSKAAKLHRETLAKMQAEVHKFAEKKLGKTFAEIKEHVAQADAIMAQYGGYTGGAWRKTSVHLYDCGRHVKALLMASPVCLGSTSNIVMDDTPQFDYLRQLLKHDDVQSSAVSALHSELTALIGSYTTVEKFVAAHPQLAKYITTNGPTGPGTGLAVSTDNIYANFAA